MNIIDLKLDSTPIVTLTVGDLKAIIKASTVEQPQTIDSDKRYVYGLKGIATTLNCSVVTALRLKKTGIFDPALRQIGRKIVCDPVHLLEIIRRDKKDKNDVKSPWIKGGTK